MKKKIKKNEYVEGEFKENDTMKMKIINRCIKFLRLVGEFSFLVFSFYVGLENLVFAMNNRRIYVTLLPEQMPGG